MLKTLMEYKYIIGGSVLGAGVLGAAYTTMKSPVEADNKLLVRVKTSETRDEERARRMELIKKDTQQGVNEKNRARIAQLNSQEKEILMRMAIGESKYYDFQLKGMRLISEAQKLKYKAYLS